MNAYLSLVQSNRVARGERSALDAGNTTSPSAGRDGGLAHAQDADVEFLCDHLQVGDSDLSKQLSDSTH